MKSTLRNLLEDAILDRCPELASKPKKIFGRNYRFTYGNVGWGEYLRCLGENYAIDGRGKILFNRKGEWVKWNIFNHVVIPYPKVDLAKSVLEQSDEILQKLVDLISNN